MKYPLAKILFLPFLTLTLFAGAISAAEFALEKSDKGYKVLIDKQLFTEYISDQDGAPILWPIIGPTSKKMTRNYPMLDVSKDSTLPEEKRDHPHQRSFWFTHGEVNGVDFWAIDERPGQHNKGKIRHDKFSQIQCDGKIATIQSENSWVTPKNETLCTDRRTFSFSEKDGARVIDFQIELTGVADECKFGDTKEGTFGIRVASSMDVDAKRGGMIVNAQGKKNGDAWGQRSEWVEYSGPVDGETVAVKIVDMPDSFRHPTYWHVRTYGLFAANPFGEHDFLNKQEKSGEYVLKKGETIRFHYQIYFSVKP